MTPANKGARYPSEALTHGEVEALITAAQSHTPMGGRNAAAIVLMWRGGLRCAEALSVRRQDVQVQPGGENAVVTILRPKGAHRERNAAPPRVVALGPYSMRHLGPWLREHEKRWPGSSPVICTRGGRPVDPSHFRRALPAWAARAGITRRVHPHALRHTFAFEAVLEGQPLPWISKALGHRSLLTTQGYLDHLAPHDVLVGMMERDA